MAIFCMWKYFDDFLSHFFETQKLGAATVKPKVKTRVSALLPRCSSDRQVNRQKFYTKLTALRFTVCLLFPSRQKKIYSLSNLSKTASTDPNKTFWSKSPYEMSMIGNTKNKQN